MSQEKIKRKRRQRRDKEETKKRQRKKCLPDVEPAANHALTDWIKFLHSELEEQR